MSRRASLPVCSCCCAAAQPAPAPVLPRSHGSHPMDYSDDLPGMGSPALSATRSERWTDWDRGKANPHMHGYLSHTTVLPGCRRSERVSWLYAKAPRLCLR